MTDKEKENLQAWIRADLSFNAPSSAFPNWVAGFGWRRPDGSIYWIRVEIPWALFGDNDYLGLDRLKELIEVSMENGRTKELVLLELNECYQIQFDHHNFAIYIHKDDEFRRLEREYEENH